MHFSFISDTLYLIHCNVARKVFSIVTSEMCDRVFVKPEPEPGGELGPETDTGGGGSSQYSIVDDIGVTQQSQINRV